MERLEQVEIFYFHMPRHGTFVRRKLQQQKLHDSCNLPSV